ncbi:50S ribosomal protein L3 [Patescibacteria group bacterium]|nr:50S ribosomal protein L3 [Patescibacteria group bacterium]
MKVILGKKIEMGQIFDSENRVVPVTFIEAGPCKILRIKENDTDGYEAIQIGFEELSKKKAKKISTPASDAAEGDAAEKATKGKRKRKGFRYVKEFPKTNLPDGGEQKVGDVLDVSVFAEGDSVKVSGISKGKGFQGAVKRHGFHGRNATHGVKHEERTLGSVGSAFPQRVIKGRKMPGRMGSERITVKNLKIVKIDKENNLIVLKGAVPGKRGTLLEIRGI